MLIIFDLDGTLVDTIDGLAYSMNNVLKSMGCSEHSRDSYEKFVGNGIFRLVELAMPEDSTEALINEAYEAMLAEYEYNYDYRIAVYEGVYKLLDDLRLKEHTLAVITNKVHDMAEIIMKRFFAQYPFEIIIGSGKDYPNKPNPASIQGVMQRLGYNKDETYLIGDTEVDLMAARNAEVNEVIVSWGFRGKAYMAEYSPAVLVDKPLQVGLLFD